MDYNQNIQFLDNNTSNSIMLASYDSKINVMQESVAKFNQIKLASHRTNNNANQYNLDT